MLAARWSATPAAGKAAPGNSHHAHARRRPRKAGCRWICLSCPNSRYLTLLWRIRTGPNASAADGIAVLLPAVPAGHVRTPGALLSFLFQFIDRSFDPSNERILLFPQNKTQANAWRWRPFGYAGIGVNERRRPALTRKPNRSFRSGGRGHRPQTAQSRVFRDATTQKENCTVRAVFVVRKKALNS